MSTASSEPIETSDATASTPKGEPQQVKVLVPRTNGTHLVIAGIAVMIYGFLSQISSALYSSDNTALYVLMIMFRSSLVGIIYYCLARAYLTWQVEVTATLVPDNSPEDPANTEVIKTTPAAKQL